MVWTIERIIEQEIGSLAETNSGRLILPFQDASSRRIKHHRRERRIPFRDEVL